MANVVDIPEAGTFGVTAYAPGIFISVIVDPDEDTFAFTSYAPAILTPTNVNVPADAFALSTFLPDKVGSPLTFTGAATDILSGRA